MACLLKFASQIEPWGYMRTPWLDSSCWCWLVEMRAPTSWMIYSLTR